MNGKGIDRHIGKTIHEMLPHIAVTAEESIKNILETKSPVIIHEVTVPDRFDKNRINYFYIEWYPVTDNNGNINGYGLVAQDITQTKSNESNLREKEDRILKMNQELEDKVSQRTSELAATNQTLNQLIRIDFLTGLPNRLAGQEQIRIEFLRMKRSNSSYYVMVIDIDHFKLINDLYGHDVGDKQLQFVGQILQSSIRESDFVARWGGEEFIILLRDLHGPDAINVANKLCRAVQNSNCGFSRNVTISIGLTCSSHNDENSDSILKRADKLLYVAKNNGRNQVAVDQDIAN